MVSQSFGLDHQWIRAKSLASLCNGFVNNRAYLSALTDLHWPLENLRRQISWDFFMNDTDILIQAMRIDSHEEREAFLARECHGDPSKLAAIRRVLSSESDLKKKFAGLEAKDLLIYVEELLSAEDRPQSSAADEVTGVMPADLHEEGSGYIETNHAEPPTREGVTIAGRYVLQCKIAEGGMGEVWAAKQIAPVKRRVALKLIKRGMDSRSVIARF